MGSRRNKNGVRKERIIMLASAALLLTALTVTGVYVRSGRGGDESDNVVDLSAIEIEGAVSETAENTLPEEDMGTIFAEVGTDDLDYDPSFQEANSGNVENSDEEEDEEDAEASPAKDGSQKDKAKDSGGENDDEGMIDESKETGPESGGEAEAISTTVQPILNFNEEDGLVWPIVGDILLNYSMDKTIYFPTLQQYKYNPAIVISAAEGDTITAAADGRVVSVVYEPQLGNTVVMDLGNQYELTYGQLENITVSEGSYVSVGDIIGTVASPTKYYSTEGANVYFKLTKDGEPINPLSRLN